MKGKVQTVLGEVDLEVLGHVLPHEHFELSIEKVFFKPPLNRQVNMECEFSLRNLGWIRQFPYSHKPNMTIRGQDCREALMEEVAHFKANGGGAIVENTTYSFGFPDRAEFAKKISQSTGVHVILGTGFYVHGGQSDETLKMSEELLSKIIMEDFIINYKDDISVKCGILGEVGTSWPITDFEKRSIRASAQVENELGCPVMIHPGRDMKAPAEIMRIYTEAGGSPSRVVMAHLDRTLHTKEDILEFASMGTYLEYDLFGIETSYYQQCETLFMPSDGQRIERIEHLIQEGNEDRILISHDIHTRHRLEVFGGHGFSHIQLNVLPMMKQRGFSDEVIQKILVHNPAAWLKFSK